MNPFKTLALTMAILAVLGFNREARQRQESPFIELGGAQISLAGGAPFGFCFIKGCGFWLCSCPLAPHFNRATPAFTAAARSLLSSVANGKFSDSANSTYIAS